jgi:HD-GYP domain-containing protein (c-di-GMP phosphodiesterase class II)
MLRVPVHRIQPGMVLARPIPQPHDPRSFLLQRDREIPMGLVPRLKSIGVHEVWVRHRDLEFLDDLIDEELAEQQRAVYAHVQRNFDAVIRSSTAELDVVSFERVITDLFNCLRRSKDGGILLQKLDGYDDYLMTHSTNVCYMAMLIGLKLDTYLIKERQHKRAQDAKNLHLLGLGCLLHDVGKMRIPRHILDKPGKLSGEEMVEIRKHPRYGYDMVRPCLPASASQVVLNHHQRYDGNGYPKRYDRRTKQIMPALTGKQIPVFSRIAIMADVYDAATSRRCYSEAKLPVRALYEMRTQCEGFFDPVVEATFYRTVPPFPIGQVVRLSNGAEAVVVDFNPDYPVWPKVQCLRDAEGESYEQPALEEIDLALHNDLRIVAVDDVDVTPYTAVQETAEPSPLAVQPMV